MILIGIKFRIDLNRSNSSVCCLSYLLCKYEEIWNMWKFGAVYKWCAQKILRRDQHYHMCSAITQVVTLYLFEVLLWGPVIRCNTLNFTVHGR